MKKFIILFIAFMPMLALAHYCDSQSRPSSCYNENIETDQNRLKNNLKKILSSPHVSSEYKKAIIADQLRWEQAVNNGCRGNAKCVYESFEERVSAAAGMVRKLESK